MHLISLNTRGLTEDQKRKSIYYWLRNKEADIILLQETHCCSDRDEYVWSKEWSGEALWSKGTNRSKGVAILFKPGLDVKITNDLKDENVRFIWVDVENNDIKFKLVNLYAPNNPRYRELFF